MTTDDRTERALERMFAAGRASPDPSEALIERIMAGAAVPAMPGSAPAPAPRVGLGRMLVAVLGGWPAMAGLTAAALAGVVIGFSMPDFVNGYVGTASAAPGYALTDFLPDMTELASGE